MAVKKTAETQKKKTNKTKDNNELKNKIYSLSFATNIKFDPKEMYEFLKGATKEELIDILIQNIVDTNISRDLSVKLEKIAQKLEKKVAVDAADAATLTSRIDATNSITVDYLQEIDKKFRAEQERLSQIEKLQSDVVRFVEYINNSPVALKRVNEDYYKYVTNILDIKFFNLTIDEIKEINERLREIHTAVDYAIKGYNYASKGYEEGYKEGLAEGKEDGMFYVLGQLPAKVIKKYGLKGEQK